MNPSPPLSPFLSLPPFLPLPLSVFEYFISCLKHTFRHVLQVTPKIRQLIVKPPNEDQIPSLLSLIQHEDKQQQMNKENMDTSQNQDDNDIHEDKIDEQVFDTEEDVTMTIDTSWESKTETTEDISSSEDLVKSVDSVDSVKCISQKRTQRQKKNDIKFLCQLLDCVQVEEEMALNTWIDGITLETLRKVVRVTIQFVIQSGIYTLILQKVHISM